MASKQQSQGSGSDRKQGEGDMSVSEAGRKGGQRVRELVEQGKEAEGDNKR